MLLSTGQSGDIVQSLEGKLMENARQFNVNIYQRAIFDVVEIKALRGSEELTANVVVLDREDDRGRLATMVTRDQNMIQQLGILGIEVNQEIREMLPPLRRAGGSPRGGTGGGGVNRPYAGFLFLPAPPPDFDNGTFRPPEVPFWASIWLSWCLFSSAAD